MLCVAAAGAAMVAITLKLIGALFFYFKRQQPQQQQSYDSLPTSASDADVEDSLAAQIDLKGHNEDDKNDGDDDADKDSAFLAGGAYRAEAKNEVRGCWLVI